MNLVLATSYDGIYEGIAVWHGIALLAAGISAAIAHSPKRWRAISGLIAASVSCLFDLPPTILVIYASADGGSMAGEWIALIILTVVSAVCLAIALRYSVISVRNSKIYEK